LCYDTDTIIIMHNMPEHLGPDDGQGREFTAPQESKEKQPPMNIIIVCRDNSTFSNNLPEIVKVLEEQGHTVEVQSFPAGTDPRQITAWYKANYRRLADLNVVADYTAKMASYNLQPIPAMRPDVILDQLMKSYAASGISEEDNKRMKEITGKGFSEESSREYIECLERFYAKIMEEIPEEKRREMEIVILTGDVEDKFPKLVFHDGQFAGSAREFAENLKRWLETSGVKSVSIYNSGAELPPETVERLKSGQAHVVFNRHTYTQKMGGSSREFWGPYLGDSDRIKEVSALQTPIETFKDDVRSKVGVAGDVEALKRATTEAFSQVKPKAKRQ
jgi:hypothetical protein